MCHFSQGDVFLKKALSLSCHHSTPFPPLPHYLWFWAFFFFFPVFLLCFLCCFSHRRCPVKQGHVWTSVSLVLLSLLCSEHPIKMGLFWGNFSISQTDLCCVLAWYRPGCCHSALKITSRRTAINGGDNNPEKKTFIPRLLVERDIKVFLFYFFKHIISFYFFLNNIISEVYSQNCYTSMFSNNNGFDHS